MLSTNVRAAKISDTFKRKHIDNFKDWRDKARKSGIIPNSNRKLTLNNDLAFLVGLILGDGCLTKLARTECLRITLGTDKPQLANYSVQIIAKVFGKKPSIIKRKSSNCFNVTLYQNNICSRLGIPSGAKANNVIYFPNWIWQNNDHLRSLLSGLFEAEASYSVHFKTCTYNFQFSNVNTSILDGVESILYSLGYHPERRINSVRLRRKSEAEKFKDFISFRTYPDI